METRYTKSHEWIAIEGDDVASVGITERLILENGRVVFIESSEVGAEYEQDEPIGVLETREGVEIVYHAPATGEVIEVNESLQDDAGVINVSPEGDGWILRMRVEFPDELDSLMTPEEYEFFEDEEKDSDDFDDDY